MRYIKIAIVAIVAILLVSFAMANREPVTIRLMTDRLAELVGLNRRNVTLPLFMVLMGGVAVGLILGYIFEWLREHKHRRAATVNTRKARRLKRQVEQMKKEKNKEKDEVLTILEEAN